MGNITCTEASKFYKMTPRRIQQLCKNGEIDGAVKVGKSWMIPESNLPTNNELLPLPIGVSDYKEAVSNYYYVDKTLIIKDIIDNKTKVSLYTRPRRFGKTLNMDMIRVYFEKSDEDTSVYFKDKLIYKCDEKYLSYQGKYPVIFLTFKDVKCLDWNETYEKIKKLISLEFQRHMVLANSDKLNTYEKDLYAKISSGEASQIEYQMALQMLSMLLYKHYGKECIILIDEYDTPIQQGYSSGFYNEIINFMRNFFSGGLKDNNNLAFGFLTGILRVAKESIFSGLNNIKINSILENNYSEYFGFTDNEVKEMLSYYGVSGKYNEVLEWYDGYKFGNTRIFNPWSVINYIDDKCSPKAFWQSTGSNDVIGEIISNANDEIIENLHRLLTGQSVLSYVDTNIVYKDINNAPYSIFSFLLLAGYLTVTKIYPQNDGEFMCELSIPNKEISFIYEKEILSRTGRNSTAVLIQQAIFNCDVKKLSDYIEQFLKESVSVFDGTNESFYHGMMLGLCALVSNKYKVLSNIESGYGRLDIELIPTSKNNPAFIFELKYVKDEKDLDLAAEKALTQILEKDYEYNMKSKGLKVIKLGVAFHGKKSVVKSNESL